MTAGVVMLCIAYSYMYIIHISDLHFGHLLPESVYLRWENLLMIAQADLIIMSGDFITFGEHYVPRFINFIKALQIHDGILLSTGNHEANIFEYAATKGVRLCLSGHTHGGQISVPFAPQLNIVAFRYPYSSGYYKYNHSHLPSQQPYIKSNFNHSLFLIKLDIKIMKP